MCAEVRRGVDGDGGRFCPFVTKLLPFKVGWRMAFFAILFDIFCWRFLFLITILKCELLCLSTFLSGDFLLFVVLVFLVGFFLQMLKFPNGCVFIPTEQAMYYNIP